MPIPAVGLVTYRPGAKWRLHLRVQRADGQSGERRGDGTPAPRRTPAPPEPLRRFMKSRARLSPSVFGGKFTRSR